jgi:hypothetical protein
MHTYGPLRVAAAVVHPASLHLVDILVVSFSLHIVKLDDPKSFCKGELLCPLYARCPPGLDHLPQCAPFGKDTRWRVTGAIYGLIQARQSQILREVIGGAKEDRLLPVPVR